MRSNIDSSWTSRRLVPITVTAMITVIRAMMMVITIVDMNEENEEQIMFIIFNIFLTTDSRYLQEPEIIHWIDHR